MTPEQEAWSPVAGHLVNFVCLDAGASSADDKQFQSHCHFVPRVGERLVVDERTYEVIRVYHRVSPIGSDVATTALATTVVCGYLGSSPTYEQDVEELLRSLQQDDTDEP